MATAGAGAARRVVRRALFLLLSAVAVAATGYLVLLLFPTPFFRHSQRLEGYRLYSDSPLPTGLAAIAAETDRRVAAMEHAARRTRPRVYLCNSSRRYAFYAALTRKSPESLAIGLGLANQMFVSMERVERFAAQNRGRLRHTRFEGNLAGVLAHEIAHFHSLRALGYRAHVGLPVWKSEGWAEYQANRWAIRRDPGYDLHRRIEQLLDPGLWASSDSRARNLWEWQLLFEFLGEVRGYRLADLARPEVTIGECRRQMLEWHATAHRNPAPPDRDPAPPGSVVPLSGSSPGS